MAMMELFTAFSALLLRYNFKPSFEAQIDLSWKILLSLLIPSNFRVSLSARPWSALPSSWASQLPDLMVQYFSYSTMPSFHILQNPEQNQHRFEKNSIWCYQILIPSLYKLVSWWSEIKRHPLHLRILRTFLDQQVPEKDIVVASAVNHVTWKYEYHWLLVLQVFPILNTVVNDH